MMICTSDPEPSEAPYRASSAKLAAIGKHLAPRCGFFKWKVLSAKVVGDEGLYDPPCAVLRGTWGPFTIDLAADGTLWVDGGPFTELDMQQTSFQVGFALCRAVSYWQEPR